MGRLSRSVLWFLIAISSVSSRIEAQEIRDLQIDAEGLRFTLDAPPSDARFVPAGAEPARIEIDGLPSFEAGELLQAPARVVWIALPPEGGFAVSSETLEIETPASVPWPASIEGDLPSRSVAPGDPVWMRDLRLLPILWWPVSRESGSGRIERSVRIDVRFTGAAAVRHGAGSRDRWSGIADAILLNAEQASAFRREAARRKLPQGDYFSTTDAPWLRIEVSTSGIFSITGSDLQRAGIDLASIVPSQLRLFTGTGISLPERTPPEELPEWLHEVSVRLDGLADAQFDPQDRILFRGVGPDAWYADLGLPDKRTERYRTDEFSNANTYWLSWGEFEGTPRRWTTLDGSSPGPLVETSALHRIHFERNLFFDPRPRTITAGGFPYSDTLPSWEKWHWLELIASRSNLRYQVPFQVSDPAPGTTGRLRVRMWGASWSAGSSFRDHYLTIDVDRTTVSETAWDNLVHRDVVAEAIPLTGVTQELGLLAPFRDDPLRFRQDRSYLAWFEIDYTRNLIARGDSLDFWVPPDPNPRSFSIRGLTAGSDVAVIDISDPIQTREIAPLLEADGAGRKATLTLAPDADRLRHIAVIDLDRALRPRIVRDTPPEDGYLRESTAAVDYILITAGEFRTAAERLADWRRSAEGGGLSVRIVDVQDIYDEFSAGRPDPTAIRNFLKFAYGSWNGGDPSASPTDVLFLGDANVDFRGYAQQGTTFWVPSYEGYYDAVLRQSIYTPQFASDDWFVLFDPSPDPAMDMATGRLPADSPASASAMVDKVISYESSPGAGGWQQRFTLVADDVCQGVSGDALGFVHMRQTESLGDSLPSELYRDRVFLYEYGKECVYDRKPAAAQALRESILDGTLVVNYTGHGSEGQLADERVLETSGVAGLTNADRLFFFLTASCSVGKFNFDGTGLGEALMRQPAGGAIGVFSATAVAFSGSNAELNRQFFQACWPGRDLLLTRPLGEVAVVSKFRVSNPASLNTRRYPLIGEPRVRLGVPGLRCALQIFGEDGNAAPDTLLRGDFATLRGSIVDGTGSPVGDARGSVQFVVYDSEILREEGGSGQAGATYNLTGASIFRGTAEVRDGTFETGFVVPGALRTGRRGLAQAYAYFVGEDGREAIGGIDDISAPERPPDPNADAQGPKIDLRALGDPDLEALPFDARWEAILEDSSGINITRLVPSRSVLLRIEEGTRLVALEDLADAVVFPESYRVGRLEFSLPAGLESGRRYTMTLEASDNRDQRGGVAVEFVLQGGGEDLLRLGRVYNVPNPLDGETTFFVSMSQSAEVRIRVYTLGGKMIREIRSAGLMSPVEAASTGIAWDGRDEEGDRLANGVYFYRVDLRGQQGASTHRIERLAVLR